MKTKKFNEITMLNLKYQDSKLRKKSEIKSNVKIKIMHTHLKNDCNLNPSFHNFEICVHGIRIPDIFMFLLHQNITLLKMLKISTKLILLLISIENSMSKEHKGFCIHKTLIQSLFNLSCKSIQFVFLFCFVFCLGLLLGREQSAESPSAAIWKQPRTMGKRRMEGRG